MLITDILGREILDSRGNPTLEVEVVLENGFRGRASVPSGASTGSKEAYELRDQDPQRFNGKGLLNNIKIIANVIRPQLIGLNAYDQLNIDQTLMDLDGTKNKSRLGANTLLAASLATSKAAAKSMKLPLFRYISPSSNYIIPVPLINIINGGVHADNPLDLQEFMIVPIKADSFMDSMRIASEIFHCLRLLLSSDGHNVNYGDEGGFAPQISSSREALEYIDKACRKAGYFLKEDILIAIDAAASEFYIKDHYYIKGENSKLSYYELTEYYEKLLADFPIYSIEDPISEYDLEGWKYITERLAHKIQLVGDDLFVTNPEIFREGIKKGLANAILVKPNQIGILSQTLEVINIAKQNKYNTLISHRSGETEDTTISHLAVATNAMQIKTGSMARSERLAKYNELIRISEELGSNAEYAGIYFRTVLA